MFPTNYLSSAKKKKWSVRRQTSSNSALMRPVSQFLFTAPPSVVDFLAEPFLAPFGGIPLSGNSTTQSSENSNAIFDLEINFRLLTVSCHLVLVLPLVTARARASSNVFRVGLPVDFQNKSLTERASLFTNSLFRRVRL